MAMDSTSKRVVTCDPLPGFSPGIGRYLAQLTEIRRDLLKQVAGLTPEQLSWRPNEEVESIGTQLLHVAAIEWSWVFEEIFRRSSDDYDGWEEALPIRIGRTQVSGQPLAYFSDRLARVRTETSDALRQLNDADLPRLVTDASPPPEEGDDPVRYSIDWVLFHLVHHEAHHAGQVELLHRLLPESVSRGVGDQD